MGAVWGKDDEPVVKLELHSYECNDGAHVHVYDREHGTHKYYLDSGGYMVSHNIRYTVVCDMLFFEEGGLIEDMCGNYGTASAIHSEAHVYNCDTGVYYIEYDGDNRGEFINIHCESGGEEAFLNMYRGIPWLQW